MLKMGGPARRDGPSFLPLRDRFLRSDEATETDPMHELDVAIPQLMAMVTSLEGKLRDALDAATAATESSTEARRQCVTLQEALAGETSARRDVDTHFLALRSQARDVQGKDERIAFLEGRVEDQDKRLSDAQRIASQLEERLVVVQYEVRKAEAQRDKEQNVYADKSREMMQLLGMCNEAAKRGDGGGTVAQTLDSVRSADIAQLRVQLQKMSAAYDTALAQRDIRYGKERDAMIGAHAAELSRRDTAVEGMRMQLAALTAHKTYATVSGGESFEECLRFAQQQVELVTRERDELESSVEHLRRTSRATIAKMQNEAAVVSQEAARAKAEVGVLQRTVSELQYEQRCWRRPTETVE